MRHCIYILLNHTQNDRYWISLSQRLTRSIMCQNIGSLKNERVDPQIGRSHLKCSNVEELDEDNTYTCASIGWYGWSWNRKNLVRSFHLICEIQVLDQGTINHSQYNGCGAKPSAIIKVTHTRWYQIITHHQRSLKWSLYDKCTCAVNLLMKSTSKQPVILWYSRV